MQMAPGFAFVSRSATSTYKPTFQGQNTMLGYLSYCVGKGPEGHCHKCLKWKKNILYMTAQIHLNRKLAAKQIK